MPLKNIPWPLGWMLAAIAGYFTDMAFPSDGFWVFAFVGLALLVIALQQRGYFSSFMVGTIFGLVFFLNHTDWNIIATDVPVWIALASAEALFIGLLALVWRSLRLAPIITNHLWLAALSFATLWVLVEQLRSYTPWSGFPWGRLIFSQADSWFSNYAWLLGSAGASFIITFVGVWLGYGILALMQGRWIFPLTAVVGSFAIFMAALLIPISSAAQHGSINVATVQGVDDPAADATLLTRGHLEVAQELIAEHPEGLDIIVLPETSVPYDLNMSPQLKEEMLQIFSGQNVLVGTSEFVPNTDLKQRYNTAILWQDGVETERYNKQRPVAFGEYVPSREFFRKLSPQVDRVPSDVVAGTDPAISHLELDRYDDSIGLALGICFEVAYDDIIRQGVQAGGELLIIPTNNIHFGWSDESDQQLAMAQIRAIEAGRSVVLSSTTGVSALILPNGKVVSSLELFDKGYLQATLPLRTELSPGIKYGQKVDWVLYGLGGLFLVSGAISRLTRVQVLAD